MYRGFEQNKKHSFSSRAFSRKAPVSRKGRALTLSTEIICRSGFFFGFAVTSRVSPIHRIFTQRIYITKSASGCQAFMQDFGNFFEIFSIFCVFSPLCASFLYFLRKFFRFFAFSRLSVRAFSAYAFHSFFAHAFSLCTRAYACAPQCFARYIAVSMLLCRIYNSIFKILYPRVFPSKLHCESRPSCSHKNRTHPSF